VYNSRSDPRVPKFSVTKSLDRTRKALEGDKKLERKLERISVQLKV